MPLRRLSFDMKLFISYDYKAFPIYLLFLDSVGVCLKHSSFDLEETFFTEKRLKTYLTHNVHKKCRRRAQKGAQKLLTFYRY